MRTPSTTLRLAGAGLAIVLTLLAAGPARAQRAATGVDWSTFGFDLQRTGENPSETTIGLGNAGQLHLLWSFHVNATTVSQAMVADGVLIRGTPTQVVYIGAENGYVFAVRHPPASRSGSGSWASRKPPTTAADPMAWTGR